MSKQISIISDDIIFPRLFESYLLKKISRLELTVCKSFQDIDAKIDVDNIDLLLIDGGMSKISSIEVIHYIRMRKLIIAPIWFFPEIKLDRYIYRAQLMGATKIIFKPFDPNSITDNIALLLEKKYQYSPQ